MNKRWLIINGICLAIVILAGILQSPLLQIGTGVIIALSFGLSLITMPLVLFVEGFREEYKRQIEKRGKWFWLQEGIYDSIMLFCLLTFGWNIGFLFYLAHAASVQIAINRVL